LIEWDLLIIKLEDGGIIGGKWKTPWIANYLCPFIFLSFLFLIGCAKSEKIEQKIAGGEEKEKLKEEGKKFMLLKQPKKVLFHQK